MKNSIPDERTIGMELTAELIEKAKATKSLEEFIALAKENNYELTETEAIQYFDLWHSSGEVAFDELENTAGGCVDKHHNLSYRTNMVCQNPDCKYETFIDGKWRDETIQCPHCGQNTLLGVFTYLT